jgi:hypothetical protein
VHFTRHLTQQLQVEILLGLDHLVTRQIDQVVLHHQTQIISNLLTLLRLKDVLVDLPETISQVLVVVIDFEHILVLKLVDAF